MLSNWISRLHRSCSSASVLIPMPPRHGEAPTNSISRLRSRPTVAINWPMRANRARNVGGQRGEFPVHGGVQGLNAPSHGQQSIASLL